MAADSAPNIILINCDDLGYGDLGCFGSSIHRTPAIDSLARDGMRFTDFYMASPVCSPSRGAMMTGCYPPRISFDLFEEHGVLFPGQPLGMSSEETTVAGLLKQRDYATMIIGKWHCGDQPEFLPTRHGFDSYYGLPFSNDMGRQAGAKDKLWPPLPLVRDEEVIQQQPDQATLTERYTEEAVRFIRRNQDRRFFLYLAHMHVHLPHYVPQHFLDASRNGRYGAAVEYIDWSTAVLLHELSELELAGNTLVVFTSDNGSNTRYGGSNQPLRGRKGQTWEGGIRVPCIARWPGIIPAGSECSEVATAMDFLPTFAGFAGVDIPGDRIIDGRDISSLMRGKKEARSPHQAFYYYRQDRLEAVRSGRWKLHVSRESEELRELYDLEADIAETTDLKNKHRDVVQRLEELATACRDDIGDSVTGVKGRNRRPCGFVKGVKPLTEYDENHPYIIAMYDLPERG